MKTNTQIKFDTIIKEGFTPLLKPLSFKKKALNYYRQLSEVGHIINIQKDRYSHRNHIRFRINIGIFEPKVWLVMCDFKHTGQVPEYPTEPVCIIRKTINKLRGRNDLYCEVDEDLVCTFDVDTDPDYFLGHLVNIRLDDNYRLHLETISG